MICDHPKGLHCEVDGVVTCYAYVPNNVVDQRCLCDESHEDVKTQLSPVWRAQIVLDDMQRQLEHLRQLVPEAEMGLLEQLEVTLDRLQTDVKVWTECSESHIITSGDSAKL